MQVNKDVWSWKLLFFTKSFEWTIKSFKWTIILIYIDNLFGIILSEQSYL